MPRQPSPAARFGTRFHAWVEARFGQQVLLDPDELPGRGDVGIEDDADLGELIERFEHGPFADRVPHAVEAPFALVLGGQVVRGRIDAVYAERRRRRLPGRRLEDQPARRPPTRSSSRSTALAWAELHGVPVEQVRAAFHYVRTGETVEPTTCPTARPSSSCCADV